MCSTDLGEQWEDPGSKCAFSHRDTGFLFFQRRKPEKSLRWRFLMYVMLSRFIGSNSLQPYCLQPARLLCRRSQMSKRLRIQVGRQSSMVGLWPQPQKFWSTRLGLGPEAASLKSSQNDPNAGGQPHPPEEVLWRAAWRFPHSRSTECISDIIELDVSGTDTSQQICMSHSKNLRDILKLPYRPCVGG